MFPAHHSLFPSQASPENGCENWEALLCTVPEPCNYVLDSFCRVVLPFLYCTYVTWAQGSSPIAQCTVCTQSIATDGRLVNSCTTGANNSLKCRKEVHYGRAPLFMRWCPFYIWNSFKSVIRTLEEPNILIHLSGLTNINLLFSLSNV